MIPVLYPSTETSFTTNGLGGLPDAISCVVTEQRNTQGGYYLEMEYPIDGLHYADIAPERIIYAAPAMGKTPQPFRISRINRPINGIVHIEAPHLCAELQKLTSWGIDTGTNVQGMIYNQFYRARQLGQTVPFWCETDITVQSDITFSHPEPTTLADILLGAEGSVLDVVGGEYEFDGYHIILHSQRGTDSGLEIRYGVNMSDIEAETDASELVTAVIPFWNGTVNDADVVVMGDMCTATNAGAYAYVRCVPLDVSDQFDSDQQPTKTEVNEKGTAFINGTGRKLLQTSIKVKYEPTTNGIGERLINLCDTVRVVYPDLGVSSISKVVETKFNTLTEQYDELTIGSIRNNIVDTIAGLISGGAITGGGGSSGGGGGSTVGAVLYNMPQNLNEAQKAQARSNIGVGSGGEAVVNLPFVTPEDYGAVGDGVHDDTNAIQAALNDGKEIVFTDGKTYLISDSLQLDSGTVIDLNGSTIQQTVDKPIFIKVSEKTAVSKLHIKNGYLVGTVTSEANTEYENQCGIYVPSYHSIYENLRFDNLNYGIYFKKRDTGSATLVENRIIDTKFANCSVAAIYSEANSKTENGIIENCKIGGTGDHGIYLYHSAGWQMTNVHVYSTCDTAIEIRGAGGTQIANLDIDRYFTTAGLVIALYSSCVVTNAKITALEPGSYCLWAQTTTSQTWTVKPLMLSNVEFATNAAAGSDIIPIHGYGSAYGVQIIYNDENGGFAPNDFEPTMYGIDRFPAISGGKQIVGTKDFNDYTESGNWFINTSVPIQNASNIPERTSGRLIVSDSTGSIGTYLYRRQEFVPFATTSAMAYVRYGSSSDGGETWTWHPWYADRDVLMSGSPIDSGSDLNDFTNPGAWLVRTDTIAQNTANIPVSVSGRLFVMDMRNGYVRGDSSIYIRQFYVPYTTAQGIYSRYGVYSSGAWTWHEWQSDHSKNSYAVELSADGTVNTFDSTLTYSAVAARIQNPAFSDQLVVTWGNSLFTADANEKLTASNGDIKFIADVEHDGIQRHIIFTLTSANSLQTTLIETYSRVPVTVWEVTDVTQGLIALNTNISSSLAWQLTGLNLSPFKRIKVYAKAGRKTGVAAADSSIVPAAIIEMLLDDRAKETVSQNVFIGSAVVQNPNDSNRLGLLTCAVSADKTKFAVVRATSLYGTAATSNTDCYQYVFKIEGYYD